MRAQRVGSIAVLAMQTSGGSQHRRILGNATGPTVRDGMTSLVSLPGECVNSNTGFTSKMSGAARATEQEESRTGRGER